MPVTLIEQLPKFTKKIKGSEKLSISEMFVNTIQGEGVNAGVPATFIRFQGCTLKCAWCDTLDVWQRGNDYTCDEVLDMLEPYKENYTPNKQHIILTGGSPLKQQDQIILFLEKFTKRFGFSPTVEVENEAVLMPWLGLVRYVSFWNNSPKLSNSKMKFAARVKPDVLRYLKDLENSTFKFVVRTEEDWGEVEQDFLPYIHRSSIILMPEGQTQEELNKVREHVIGIAIKQNVRYMDRLHIIAWNKKTGV